MRKGSANTMGSRQGCIKRWDDLKTVEQVTYYTKAGGGCAKCHPKIEAIIAFLEANPKGKALVTKPETIVNALDGKTGTWIVPD